MDSSLREKFARLGPIRTIARVTSGSPVVFVLRLPHPPGNGLPRTIDATLSLARRGMTLLAAKRAVQALLHGEEAMVELPTVEDRQVLTGELRQAGIEATRPRRAPGRQRLIRVQGPHTHIWLDSQ